MGNRKRRTDGKCQTPNVEVCNGLCADCQKALDAWQNGAPSHGRRLNPDGKPQMTFKLGDLIEDDLEAESELAGLRAAGGRR